MAKTLAKGKAKASSSKPLPKGKAKAKAKPLPKGKAKAKAKAKAGVKKDPLPKGKSEASGSKALNKKNLEALGQLSLKERIKKITEGAETAEEAVELLKQTLTPAEKQSAWGKMKTKARNDPEEEERLSKMSKKEIGMHATLSLLKEKAPTFMSSKQELQTGVSLTKGEEWQSEKQMREKFSQEEFGAHLASGRIRWRDDPWTAGYYQYQDQGDIRKTTTVNKANTYAWGQEYQDEEKEPEWERLFGDDIQCHLLALDKGKGKGKVDPGKGKAKGKRVVKKVFALAGWGS